MIKGPTELHWQFMKENLNSFKTPLKLILPVSLPLSLNFPFAFCECNCFCKFDIKPQNGKETR